MSWVFFCDFDGTVTVEDVGDAFFHHFSRKGTLEAVRLWEQGRIDSREMYLREIRHFQADPAEAIRFLEPFEIDPTFPAFVDFCQSKGIHVSIVSDGMDFYIKPILKRYGLDHLQVLSNRMYYRSGRGWRVEFPYFSGQCGRCANCKGEHLRRARRSSQRIFFAGDGLSDLCAVPHADVVFAKGQLADYCRRHHFSYEHFADFAEIQNTVTRLLEIAEEDFVERLPGKLRNRK